MPRKRIEYSENMMYSISTSKSINSPMNMTQYFSEEILDRLLIVLDGIYKSYMKEIEKTKNKKISSSSDNRIVVNNFTAIIGVIKEIIMTSNAFGISPIVTLIPNRKYKREMTTILVNIPATPYHHTITIGPINVSPTDALLSILSSIPKGENIKPPKWTYDFLEEYYNKKLKKKRKKPFKPKEKPISYEIRLLNI